MPAAPRLVVAVRQGRFGDPGVLTRGPLGLGTDFESIRDYLPDDDIRQANWRASPRTGPPIRDQYRGAPPSDATCGHHAGRPAPAAANAPPAAPGPPTTRDAA